MGLVQAKIDSDWATRFAVIQPDVFIYNAYNAEDIDAEIDLTKIGGLVVMFSEDLYDNEQVNTIRGSRSVINLAFGEVARIALTQSILKATQSQYPSETELIEQLEHRQIPTSDHGSDEAWFLPDSALEIVDLVQATTTH